MEIYLWSCVVAFIAFSVIAGSSPHALERHFERTTAAVEKVREQMRRRGSDISERRAALIVHCSFWTALFIALAIEACAWPFVLLRFVRRR